MSYKDFLDTRLMNIVCNPGYLDDLDAEKELAKTDTKEIKTSNQTARDGYRAATK